MSKSLLFITLILITGRGLACIEDSLTCKRFKVIDEVTKKPVAEAIIKLFTVNDMRLDSIISDSNGLATSFASNYTYAAIYKHNEPTFCPGQRIYVVTKIEIPDTHSDTTVLPLSSTEQIVCYTAPTVYFGLMSSTISKEDSLTLSEMALLILHCVKGTIILEGHSDAGPEYLRGKILSKRRAEAVKDFLVERGAPASQISVTFKGSDVIGCKCAHGVKCTEEEHAKNRKVYFIRIGSGEK